MQQSDILHLERELPSAPTLTARPNPAETFTVIAVDHPEQAGVSVAVFDINGKEVFRGVTRTEAYTISTVDLAPGLYFFRVGGASGPIGAGKFVKR